MRGGIVGFHHVLLAMPPGREDDARAFYVDSLGLREIEKPPELARRGGCWFRGEGIELHLGVEEGFRPARKAHPGLLVDGLDPLLERLAAGKVEAQWDTQLAGHRRCYVDDPFGNRIELIERVPAPAG